MFNHSDLHVESTYRPETGMSTHQVPAGIKATHVPTRLSATVEKYRHMHENKRAAIRLVLLEVAKQEINNAFETFELNHASVDMDGHEYLDMPQEKWDDLRKLLSEFIRVMQEYS